MRCPRCRHRPIHILAWPGAWFGPIARSRNIECSRCRARINPKSRLHRAGLNVAGLGVGIGAATALAAVLPVSGLGTLLLLLAVALPIDLAMSYSMVDYELAPFEKGELPPSRMIEY